MIQTIVTYLIIGAALYALGSSLVKTLFNKKGKSKNHPSKGSCGSCSAECILRDAVKTGPTQGIACNEIQKKLKEF